MSLLRSLLTPEGSLSASYRSRRGVERLAGFSDAVVAIAITLVMLPLIDLASERDASATKLFADDGYRLAGAALSFAVIGGLWREHHEAYERATVDSRRLVSLNLIWLAAVVFLPVPTALLFVDGASPVDERVSVCVYTATLAIAEFAMRASEWEIRVHCSPVVTPARPWWTAIRWLSPVLLTITSVLALTGLGERALWALLLTAPLQWLEVFRDHRRSPRST